MGLMGIENEILAKIVEGLELKYLKFVLFFLQLKEIPALRKEVYLFLLLKKKLIVFCIYAVFQLQFCEMYQQMYQSNCSKHILILEA